MRLCCVVLCCVQFTHVRLCCVLCCFVLFCVVFGLLFNAVVQRRLVVVCCCSDYHGVTEGFVYLLNLVCVCVCMSLCKCLSVYVYVCRGVCMLSSQFDIRYTQCGPVVGHAQCTAAGMSVCRVTSEGRDPVGLGAFFQSPREQIALLCTRFSSA